MTTRYPITHTSITVPTAAGTTLLTAADAAAQRTALGVSSITTLYASDCAAESGSESASISGTGASSTFTLTASATSRVYNNTGATAARVLCPIPANAYRIEAEMGITAASGFTTGGSRYLATALRSSGGGTPAQLWGYAWNDNPTGYWGNLTTNPNAGSINNPPNVPGVDRWQRLTWETTLPQLGGLWGSGTAGARPTVWTPGNVAFAMPVGTPTFIVDTTGSTSSLAVYLQSFGGGGATSVTAKLTVRVWTL
jgi:hypothetical protein